MMAALQLAAVHGLGVSRWRGGGMGMYSEFHPNQTQVYEVRGGSRVAVDLWTCERVPSTLCLSAALAKRPGVDALEAYRPHFDAATRTFQRVRVAHAPR